MKKCNRCNGTKSLSEFYKNKTKSDGHGTRCKACMSAYGKAWYSKNAEEQKKNTAARNKVTRKADRSWINSLKIAKGCADCGYDERAVALDFDHVRGEKLCNVGEMVGRSRERIQEEMDKCEVVCANCHRIRTEDRRVASSNG